MYSTPECVSTYVFKKLLLFSLPDTYSRQIVYFIHTAMDDKMAKG